jgi:hypothetical protein
VVIYTPRNPISMNVYEPSEAAESSASSSRCQPSATFALPLVVRVSLNKNALTSVSRGTSSSIRQLGGIRVFIYLFAKVCTTFIFVLTILLIS